jgi:hypothetical protein
VPPGGSRIVPHARSNPGFERTAAGALRLLAVPPRHARRPLKASVGRSSGGKRTACPWEGPPAMVSSSSRPPVAEGGASCDIVTGQRVLESDGARAVVRNPSRPDHAARAFRRGDHGSGDRINTGCGRRESYGPSAFYAETPDNRHRCGSSSSSRAASHPLASLASASVKYGSGGPRAERRCAAGCTDRPRASAASW